MQSCSLCDAECQLKHWPAHKQSCPVVGAEHDLAGAGASSKGEFASCELEGEECSICLEVVAASDFQLPKGIGTIRSV